MSLSIPTISLGADPEFFFVDKNGNTVGSEKIIPLNGGFKTIAGNIIVDGVQAELNPRSSTCRQSFSNFIHTQVEVIRSALRKHKGISVTLSPMVDVSKEELMSLSEGSRTFGCAPSFNVDKTMELKIKSRDALTYLKRSAGGHIHLGCVGMACMQNVPEFVNILDIVVGNTCVLLDRDVGNIERRKTYGMAGEFRLPKHGIEYRTLSNFWLRHYTVMSFVMSLARVSVAIANSPTVRKQFLDAVDIEQVRKAINNNNFSLALKNFNKIKGLFVEHNIPPFQDYNSYRNNDYNKITNLSCEDQVRSFEFLVHKGLDEFFTKDMMKGWTLQGKDYYGWENFSFNILTAHKDFAEFKGLTAPVKKTTSRSKKNDIKETVHVL